MTCFTPNIIQIQKKAKRNKNGEIVSNTSRIIFAKSKNFPGYEYYMKQNEILKKDFEEQILKYGKNPEFPDAEAPQYVMIPCTKCEGCQTAKKKEWTLRIEKEAKQYENNYFLTLTYNDENLFIPDIFYSKREHMAYINDGSWGGTLVKEHIITFLDSVRKYFERTYNHTGVKFYAVGEYGLQFNRPHYHIILMNTPKLNLKTTGINKLGHAIHKTEDRIEKIWGKGFIDIGEVSWNSIAYVAGYTEKKLYGPDIAIWDEQGQDPIFAHMSRNPGIGKKYFEEHYKEIYANDEIINSKGQPVKPGKYFDRLMDLKEKDLMEMTKKQRQQFANDELKKKMSTTTLTIKEQLLLEQENFVKKGKEYKARRAKLKLNVN